MKLGIITMETFGLASALFIMVGCAATPAPKQAKAPVPHEEPLPPNAHVVFCSGDPFSCVESADLVCSPTNIAGRDTQHPKPAAWHQWGTEQSEGHGQWSLTIVCDTDNGS